MKWNTFFGGLLVLIVPAAALGQVGAVSASPPEPPTIRTVRLTLEPAAEPAPALRYTLLPSPLEQMPGNAASMMYMASELAEGAAASPFLTDQLNDWLEEERNHLPMDNVRELLDEYADALRYVRLAARHEWCEWDYPIRSEGYGLILPSLAQFRTLAKLLALQARIAITEERFNDALDHLQIGYALARHVGKGTTIINNLVGVAIASLMTRQLETWIDTPGAPNLYWAVTYLPTPFVDHYHAFEMERELPYLGLPLIRDIRTRTLSKEECHTLSAELIRIFSMMNTVGRPEGPTWLEQARIATLVARGYPTARDYLLSQGRPPDAVKEMPAVQVVLIHALDLLDYWRDRQLKWLSLPYWQAHEHLLAYEDELQQIAREPTGGFPLTMMLPSLYRARYHIARCDRDLAAVACIEAIRMHAVANGGRLPENLDAITVVPVPIDPIAGKPFNYTPDGATAVIEILAPERLSESDSVRYEITIAR